ncbi:MAG: YbaN family protein [candidate division WOR-3 bacterium]
MRDYQRTTRASEKASTRLVRTVCIVIGTMAVVVGVIGIVIPLLPTTPFLLLAAACYARSSRRLYDWLISNRWCGKYVRSYREGEGISVGVKALTIFLLWLTIGLSALFIVSNIIVKITLLLIAIGVTAHILLLPTFRATGQKKSSITPVCRDCSAKD